MSRSDTRPLSALTIAGSDSGGGAGIQADLKTFAAHGVHGLSAIAALTAQHARGVTAVHVPPVAFLRAQIDACFDDFRIGAVKLGMLANTEVITAVADALEHHQPSHIVLDPVMVATSGAATTSPEKMARSPMGSSSRKAGRCVIWKAWNSAVLARTRSSFSWNLALASSAAAGRPAAGAATLTASLHWPTLRPSIMAARAIASRTRSSVTPKFFAASATALGTRYSRSSGSNQPALSMTGARTIVPLRR